VWVTNAIWEGKVTAGKLFGFAITGSEAKKIINKRRFLKIKSAFCFPFPFFPLPCA
jgi:hypothetical protein